MLLHQTIKLHPSTIHAIALLIYGGVYTPRRGEDEIARFFKNAGIDQYYDISAGDARSPGAPDRLIAFLNRLNTGSKNGETRFPQLSPEMEMVLKYLVDPREYDRDLHVVKNIDDKLNDVLKFEKIAVILDESGGYTPRIVSYSPNMVAKEVNDKKRISIVNNIKKVADIKKEEGRFNLKYTFYSIFGIILVVLIVLVITNFSKAVFSGIDVILLFVIVSIVVLPLFGFGLDIFTKGEYRRFLENVIGLVKQLKR